MHSQTGNNLTDQYLVAKILSGDTQAFGVIVTNTEKLVAQIVFKMISHAEDRRDLAQDVYLKAFKNLPHFRFQAKLSTWIGQITFNTCISHLEKKKLVLPDYRYDVHDMNEDPIEIIGNELADKFTNPTESLLFEKERSKVIAAGIDQLPPVYRTLIVLYHQEELSYTEIATITQLPEGTVKSYLFRARKALREKLLSKHEKEEL